MTDICCKEALKPLSTLKRKLHFLEKTDATASCRSSRVRVQGITDAHPLPARRHVAFSCNWYFAKKRHHSATELGC